MNKLLYIAFVFIWSGHTDMLAQKDILSKKDSLLIKEYQGNADKYRNINLDSSYFFLDKLEHLYSDKGLTKKQIRALMAKGNIYLIKGLTEKALQTYLEVENLSDKINHKEGRLYAAINIAAIYVETEEYEKVLDLFKKLKGELQVIDSTDIELTALSVIYNNEGIAYENLDNYKAAERSYINSIKISNKLDDKYYLANGKSNLANVKSKQDKFEEAIELHKEALQIRVENGLGVGVIQSNGNLALIYDKLGDYTVSKQYYSKALDEAVSLHVPKHISENAHGLKEILVQEGDFKGAYEMQDLIRRAGEELLNEESLKKEVRLKADYENELENKIKEKNQKQRETVLYFALGTSVLLVIIAAILYFLQKTKTRQGVLEKQNIEKEKKLLQQNLEYKNKKLVTNLMYLIQKNELISNLSSKLTEVKKSSKIEANKSINAIINELRIEMKNQSWDDFETYFQDVHIDFYKKLSKDFQLTPNELRIAAFIKLNLSSKEISSITGQTVRTIDVARYRLRKKLGLNQQEENLHTFLSKI